MSPQSLETVYQRYGGALYHFISALTNDEQKIHAAITDGFVSLARQQALISQPSMNFAEILKIFIPLLIKHGIADKQAVLSYFSAQVMQAPMESSAELYTCTY